MMSRQNPGFTFLKFLVYIPFEDLPIEKSGLYAKIGQFDLLVIWGVVTDNFRHVPGTCHAVQAEK